MHLSSPRAFSHSRTGVAYCLDPGLLFYALAADI